MTSKEMSGVAARIRLISNSFYNEGLERARANDLTGAARFLKDCLNLNKFHIQARNLLGLVYYRAGEVGDALEQWVLSANLEKKNNPAFGYIQKIQKKGGRLETVGTNIRKYNQALSQAQSGADDLAILQLNAVTESMPNYIRAELLLALLCIRQENWRKAEKAVRTVLSVDRLNPTAIRYLDVIRPHAIRESEETEKNTAAQAKNAFSHRRMQDDDVIMPPTYRENTGWQSVLNIFGGLILGAAVVFFLVMPARIRQENTSHNQNLLAYNEQLNQKSGEIAALEGQVSDLSGKNEELAAELDRLKNSNDSEAAQYSLLIRLQEAYRARDWDTITTLYPEMRPELFTDETVRNAAESLLGDISGSGFSELAAEGYAQWAAGRFDTALRYYGICLAIRPDDTNIMYNVGSIYNNKGDTENAIPYFTRIIVDYQDSPEVTKAKTRLAEISAQAAQEAARLAEEKRQQQAEAAEGAAGENPEETSGENENPGDNPDSGENQGEAQQEIPEETSGENGV